MTREQAQRVIEFCRKAFPNDGAEGESVHALCDYIEQLHADRKLTREDTCAFGAWAEDDGRHKC